MCVCEMYKYKHIFIYIKRLTESTIYEFIYIHTYIYIYIHINTYIYI